MMIVFLSFIFSAQSNGESNNPANEDHSFNIEDVAIIYEVDGEDAEI